MPVLSQEYQSFIKDGTGVNCDLRGYLHDQRLEKVRDGSSSGLKGVRFREDSSNSGNNASFKKSVLRKTPFVREFRENSAEEETKQIGKGSEHPQSQFLMDNQQNDFEEQQSINISRSLNFDTETELPYSERLDEESLYKFQKSPLYTQLFGEPSKLDFRSTYKSRRGQFKQRKIEHLRTSQSTDNVLLHRRTSDAIHLLTATCESEQLAPKPLPEFDAFMEEILKSPMLSSSKQQRPFELTAASKNLLASYVPHSTVMKSVSMIADDQPGSISDIFNADNQQEKVS